MISSSSSNNRSHDEEYLISSPINESLVPNLIVDGLKVADNENEAAINTTTNHTNFEDCIKTKKNEVISLIDISHNKEWICYISHPLKEPDSYSITRRPFIRQKNSTTITTNIPKEEIKHTTKFCCQFLSISPTGKYAAISFFETHENRSYLQNQNCLIFKVEDDNFKIHMKIRLKGRAVFFNTSEGDLCLALVSTKTVRIYNKFCDTTKSSDYYFYELPEFSSTSSTKERLLDQKSFAEETATWNNVINPALQDESNELNIVITTSRHIRDNVIVTPFNKSIGGATRVWSMADDGVRLTSFFALGEHIIAFSKDLKYAATFTDEVRAVKIYNIKSGLLVYTLKSCYTSNEAHTCYFDVSHARFCYDSRYLALSLVLKTADSKGKVVSTEVVFEVWYIEAERSIYTKTEKTGVNCAEDSQTKCKNCISNEEKEEGDEDWRACFLDSKSNKTVRPFITKGLTDDKEKRCLRGVFTYFNQSGESKIESVELDIDGGSSIKNDSELQENNTVADSSTIGIESNNALSSTASSSKIIATANQDIGLEWATGLSNDNEESNEYAEISNKLSELSDSEDLKCGYITIGGERKYLIRFGKRTIQLWRWSDSHASGDKEDLVYIRAYKGPDYGLAYSFKSTWQIYDMGSIKFIEGGIPAGRLIVNIREYDTGELEGIYHTEEIFLPIESDTTNENEEFDYHKLESACQALHFLHTFLRKKDYKFEANEKETEKKEFEKELKFKDELKRMSSELQKQRIKARNKKMKLKENSMKLFEKTREIIDKAIASIHEHSPNFFSTIAGSRALAMLASFSEGRDIIVMILKNKTIPISIFSYPVCIGEIEENESNPAKLDRTAPDSEDPNRKSDEYRNSPKPDEVLTGYIRSIAENENVLTVLVRELDYDLFNLMFNRILHDSKRNGPGCLSALVDVLIYLQEEGNADLLLKSSQKLSYLEIERSVLGILNSEIREKLKVIDLQKEVVANIRNLECHSTMEQMSKYTWKISQLNYRLKQWIYNKYDVKNVGALLRFKESNIFVYLYRKLFKESKKEAAKRTKLCVVPLPYFNTYDRLPEDRYRNKRLKTPNGVLEQGNLYKRKSAFITVASDQGDNNFFRQGDSVLEVMLQYKWKKFIRTRFVGVCLIHVVYYVTYCTGVLFAKEMYDYDAGNNITDTRHIASLIILLASGLVLFAQELHQIIRSQIIISYFCSGYNYVDILALIFPLVTFLQMRLGGNYFYEISCVGTLIIWLHGILRLRVLLFFGIAIETIIQLARKVASILFVLVVMVFAFTHAFIVLLRRQPDEFFQENYNGTTSLPNGGDGTTNMLDISASNGFKDPFKAFYQVWLIIFGVWDSIINGNAGDDRMLFVLCILFALVTVLIFTNIVIALMSSTVDEVRTRGKRVWVNHFASVIAEIEQLWCFWPRSVKHSRKNNPCYIYYIANYDAVKKHEEKLEEETEKLRKEIFRRLGDDSVKSITLEEGFTRFERLLSRNSSKKKFKNQKIKRSKLVKRPIIK